jgi:ribosomal protein S30
LLLFPALTSHTVLKRKNLCRGSLRGSPCTRNPLSLIRKPLLLSRPPAPCVTYIHTYIHTYIRSRDSSVVWRWATGWMIGGSNPGRRWEFSLHHRVQTGSGAHPASYPMCTTDSSPGGKAAGARNQTPRLTNKQNNRIAPSILNAVCITMPSFSSNYKVRILQKLFITATV